LALYVLCSEFATDGIDFSLRLQLLLLWDVGVNRLAGFELNKERLFAAGLLSLCFQLLDGSCTDDEILVATQTFWILSFNPAVRADVISSHLYMQGNYAVVVVTDVCCCCC